MVLTEVDQQLRNALVRLVANISLELRVNNLSRDESAGFHCEVYSWVAVRSQPAGATNPLSCKDAAACKRRPDDRRPTASEFRPRLVPTRQRCSESSLTCLQRDALT